MELTEAVVVAAGTSLETVAHDQRKEILVRGCTILVPPDTQQIASVLVM